MFEHLFFIYLNCFLRTIFVRIIIFMLSYYVVSLPYPYLGFLKFVVSQCPVMSYLRGRIRVHASLLFRAKSSFQGYHSAGSITSLNTDARLHYNSPRILLPWPPLDPRLLQSYTSRSHVPLPQVQAASVDVVVLEDSGDISKDEVDEAADEELAEIVDVEGCLGMLACHNRIMRRDLIQRQVLLLGLCSPMLCHSLGTRLPPLLL